MNLIWDPSSFDKVFYIIWRLDWVWDSSANPNNFVWLIFGLNLVFMGIQNIKP